MDSNINEVLIKKQIINPGKQYKKLKPGTRVKFHFQTRKVNDTVIIDDSKRMGKPMELVLGKKFKLEVWEVIVQKMALDEVAKFIVDKSLVNQYPFISKTLRDVGRKVEERRHCCGMTLQNEGMGYKDLDELFANPSDLEFTIELISVEMPDEYKKERWQMSDEEKLENIQSLRENGNKMYNLKKYDEAEICYAEAIGMLDQLMLKEKPHDEEWLELAAMKVPLMLNYAQCRLLENDFYAVIIDCTEVLKLDPDNVKAYYRRAKANFGAWNLDESKKDFERALELDKSLEKIVAKELKAITEEQRLKDIEDRVKMQKLF